MTDNALIVGIHGILSRGGGSTDLVLEHLKEYGHRTLEFDWGPRPAILSGAFAARHARRLRELIRGESCVHLVTHSFGGRIALELMRQGRLVSHVYMFNPAISARTEFIESRYEKITVIANSRDRILSVGERLLPWAGYGALGRVGYFGESERVVTHFGPQPDSKGLRQHGAAFTPANLRFWAGYIHDEIVYPY